MEEEAEVLSPAKPDFRQRHLSDVTSVLGGLWRRRLYTDLTLLTNGKCVRCHRVVLASASPYFHSRLFNGKRETSIDKLFIRDVSWEVLSEVLEFVYAGECRLREDNAEELLKAAAVFQIIALKDMCELFLTERVQAQNALQLYKVARTTRSPHLDQRSLEVLQVHLPQLLGTKLFRQLSHHEIISITSRYKDTKAQPEETVFRAVTSWLHVDIARRKQMLREILRRVPLSLAHQKELLLWVAGDEEDTSKKENKRVHFQKTPDIAPKKDISTNSQDGEDASLVPEPSLRDKQLEEVLVTVGGVEEVEGGYQRSQHLHAFHPSSKHWLPLAPLPLVSDSGAAYCTRGNDIFISGVGEFKKGLMRYEAGKNSWQILASMSIGRRGHAMVTVGSCLYVLGGMTQSYDSPQLDGPKPCITAVVERYDILNNTWAVAGNLTSAVWGASVIVFKEKIHVFGGFQDKDRPTSMIQTFDPQSKISRMSSQLPFPVALSQAAVTNDDVVLMSPSGVILTTSDCWRFKVVLSLMGFRRVLFGMTVHQNRVYVVGGKRGKTVHDDILMVDLQSGTVRQLVERLPRPLWGCGFFSISLDRAQVIDKKQVDEMMVMDDKGNSHEQLRD